MTIPEKLKIGAKVYGVEITNKLDLGNVNYSGEISYTEHDEKKVDELANVLHMVILDNPAVFAPVKEGQHENG